MIDIATNTTGSSAFDFVEQRIQKARRRQRRRDARRRRRPAPLSLPATPPCAAPRRRSRRAPCARRSPASARRRRTTSTPYKPDRAQDHRQRRDDAERQHRERQLDHRPLRQELHGELAVHRRFGRHLPHELAHLAAKARGARRLDDVGRRSHRPRRRRRSRQRKVDDGLAGVPPVVLLHVLHDADDREPLRRVAGATDPLPEGIPIGPQPRGRRLADDDAAVRRDRFVGCELASAQQRRSP